MEETKTTTKQQENTVKPDTSSQGAAFAKNNKDQDARGVGGKKTFIGRRGRKGRQEKFKPEFDQKILGIRRVTRVMAGGRRFSFSVSMVAGDRKGRVGVGLGKGSDTAVAIEKAFNNAKKNMVRLPLKKDMTIPHEVEAKFCSSRVLIMPAPGKGLVAGGAVRSVLDLGGVHDVSAKILSRSKNALNNARVTVQALESLLSAPAGEENKKTVKKTPQKTETKPKDKQTV